MNRDWPAVFLSGYVTVAHEKTFANARCRSLLPVSIGSLSATFAEMSSLSLFDPRIEFTHSIHSRRHEGPSCFFGSTEATHTPIVLYNDGSAMMGIESASYGREHLVSLRITFLDRHRQKISYQEWIATWGPTLTNSLNSMQEPQSRQVDESGRCPQASDIGLDISVGASRIHAAAWYKIFWVPDRSRSKDYYIPLAHCDSGCRQWCMEWCEEQQKAVLQSSAF